VSVYKGITSARLFPARFVVFLARVAAGLALTARSVTKDTSWSVEVVPVVVLEVRYTIRIHGHKGPVSTTTSKDLLLIRQLRAEATLLYLDTKPHTIRTAISDLKLMIK